MNDGFSTGAKSNISSGDLADRIVQEAELRTKEDRASSQATSERPTDLIQDRKKNVSARSYLGMSRDTSEVVDTDPILGANTSTATRSPAAGLAVIDKDKDTSFSGTGEDGTLYVSSLLGLPLLSNDPAPLSNALKIPTLLGGASDK